MTQGARLLAEALKASSPTITQRKVERDLDVASGLVTRWLKGTRKPDIDAAVALERMFGIPPAAWTVEDPAAERVSATGTEG